MTILEKYSHDQWLFNCVTSCVKALGWLKNKEEEDENF